MYLKYIYNCYQYLINKESIWSFPKYVFKQLGDLKFLLKCNYSIEKIPAKQNFINKLLWHGHWPTNIISHQRGIIFGTTKTSYTKINLYILITGLKQNKVHHRRKI